MSTSVIFPHGCGSSQICLLFSSCPLWNYRPKWMIVQGFLGEATAMEKAFWTTSIEAFWTLVPMYQYKDASWHAEFFLHFVFLFWLKAQLVLKHGHLGHRWDVVWAHSLCSIPCSQAFLGIHVECIELAEDWRLRSWGSWRIAYLALVAERGCKCFDLLPLAWIVANCFKIN